MAMAGVLNINKPAGITSHDAVDRIRKTARTRKVGHTGTLDPMATGVLPICVGQATKIAQYLMAQDKEYLVDMRLGLVTDSQDTVGVVLEERDWSGVTEAAVRAALSGMVGPQKQIPPMVSAKRHQGRRLYELAREGREIERKPCDITIHEMELIYFDPPLVRFRAVCSKGTYVRTLCHDLGEVLRCGAAMSGLVRTRAGSFRLEEAVSLEQLTTREDVQACMVSMADALSLLPALLVREEAAGMVITGRQIPAAMVEHVVGRFAPHQEVRVVGPGGELLCIATAAMKSDIVERVGGKLGVARPVRVLLGAGDEDERRPRGRSGGPKGRPRPTKNDLDRDRDEL